MSATTTYMKKLSVPLSEVEIRERGQQLAHLRIEVEKEKLAAKEAASQRAAKIKSLDSRVMELAHAVENKREDRDVQVRDQVNTRLWRMETIRLDTEEVAEVRPLTDAELEEAQQASLPFSGPEGDVAPSGDGSYPDHPELAEGVRAPDARVACPGPEGSEGCKGEECTRCAGMLWIPSDSVKEPEPEPTATEALDPDATSDGTEIDDPSAVLKAAEAAAVSVPEEKGRKGRKGHQPPAGAH